MHNHCIAHHVHEIPFANASASASLRASNVKPIPLILPSSQQPAKSSTAHDNRSISQMSPPQQTKATATARRIRYSHTARASAPYCPERRRASLRPPRKLAMQRNARLTNQRPRQRDKLSLSLSLACLRGWKGMVSTLYSRGHVFRCT